MANGQKSARVSGTVEQGTIVSMPEAAMYKNYGVITRQNNIRFSRQVANMKTEPESLLVQNVSNQYFRFGVASPYAGHHPAAGGAVHHIDHQANSGNASGVPSRSCEISA